MPAYLRTPALAASAMLAAVAVLFAPVPARAVGESPPIAYNLHCIGCHFEDGMGARSGGVPPIPGMSGHLLKHAKGRLYLAHVPGIVNAHLPHAETAALINYVLERWAAKELPAQWERFTGEELERLRAEKVDDITALRKEIAADLLKQGIDISF